MIALLEKYVFQLNFKMIVEMIAQNVIEADCKKQLTTTLFVHFPKVVFKIWLIFDDLNSEFYEMIAKMIVEKHFENRFQTTQNDRSF